MKALQVLLEDEGVQTMIDEKTEPIMEASEELIGFSDLVQEHVMANLNEFVEPGNLEETYKNIVAFTEAAVANYADQLSTRLAEAE